jgi:Leucine-rich repeat (LRR) protein
MSDKKINSGDTFMENNKHAGLRFLLCLLLSVSGVFAVSAQEADDPNIEKVQGLVSYYRFMLNTVGGQRASMTEKETIINSSFDKVFRDPEVQIEDDLSLDRSAIVNKNVQAYLRDVDFFFQEIKFEFEDIEVSRETNEVGDPYYLVSFMSSWEGKNLEGEEVSNSGERFMEVNIDDQGDIKIVSVYTTKVSRAEQLRSWWDELPVSWDNYFREKFSLGYDSVDVNRLEEISAIDSLNLEGERWIEDVQALSIFRGLKKLNLRNTRVSDLVPLRYAQNLSYLDISATNIRDISSISYFKNLRQLYIEDTPVNDLSPISEISDLEVLDISNVSAISFAPIANLSLKKLDLAGTAFSETKLLSQMKDLRWLNLEKTYVVGLAGLTDLEKLEYLNVANTYVSNLRPLRMLQNLTELRIDHTEIADISVLKSLEALRKVYADYTNVGEKAAEQFMNERPNVLVVTNASGVLNWWERLSVDWKSGLLRNSPYEKNLTIEQIIQLLQSDSLDLSGLRLLQGEPLTRFTRLKYVDLSDNLFSNLDFLGTLTELEVLKANNLPIDQIFVLKSLTKLRRVELKKLLTLDLQPLAELSNLQYLNLEGTPIEDVQAMRLWQENPELLIIYRTEKLVVWWESLSPEYKSRFSKRIGEDPTHEELHAFTQSSQLEISGTDIIDVYDIQVFHGLEELKLTNTSVSNLYELSDLKALTSLAITNGPFSNLESLRGLDQLRALSIANTPVEDLDGITALKNLEKLDCSGTQIKNIKELRDLKSLTYLDISNTKAWQLHWLFEHPEFKELICYNSRVRENKLEDFKSTFPDCKITYY